MTSNVKLVIIFAVFSEVLLDSQVVCSKPRLSKRRLQSEDVEWKTKLSNMFRNSIDDGSKLGNHKSSRRLDNKRMNVKKASENRLGIHVDEEFHDQRKLAELKYFVSLDSKGDFNLYWDFDDITETIFFRVEAKIEKSDLLAFGFSDYGESENADLCVMWTGLDGKHRFEVNN